MKHHHAARSVLLLLFAPLTARASTFDVTQSGIGFSPSNITIEVGDTVRWTRTSGIHTVTEGTDGTVDGDEAFNGFLGACCLTFEVTFDSALLNANPRPGGVYDYFCEPHFPSMKGKITVGQPGIAYCFGDDLDPIVTADCPCTNFGAPGAGCANSFSSLGALLSVTGTTSPNTVLFTVSRIPNNTLATGLRTTGSASSGVVFGDGVWCQSGTRINFGQHNSGTLGDPDNTWSAVPPSVASGTRYYSVQYRNSAPAFCPPAQFNVTSAYAITW